MVTAEQRNHAKAFLQKAEEYVESAEDNVDLERFTPAAGDAIHAGISAKDAIATSLSGATGKTKDHARAAKELAEALGARAEAKSADRALRELVAARGDVEYGVGLVSAPKAETLVRRARLLVDLAVSIVRLGR
ncbi:hypothetical protein FB381_4112 [Nocardioides albertanoniae]|uniref:HEPN domain-containing protein n=1 Tax=Nocardioides albertanoniae TaxID=1175486 RepID=A0A543AC63_9ACTN|nr:hypothetical protein [Nocardioides albertanoniae]TQL70183.1 hypothetical protein FB381_4112 [Nocardioides albertanoniae]